MHHIKFLSIIFKRLKAGICCVCLIIKWSSERIVVVGLNNFSIRINYFSYIPQVVLVEIVESKIAVCILAIASTEKILIYLPILQYQRTSKQIILQKYYSGAYNHIVHIPECLKWFWFMSSFDNQLSFSAYLIIANFLKSKTFLVYILAS